MSTNSDQEQHAKLRGLYAEWGKVKAVLDSLAHDINVLEHEMGYTAHVGGPPLMKRREGFADAAENALVVDKETPNG